MFLKKQRKYKYFPFVRYKIKGDSMLPTLTHGQTVVIFRWGKVRAGDVIVFSHEGLVMIKRAIALRGDRWHVRGDNPRATTDSEDFGEVSAENIIGKVCFRP